ncbi:hypothetical protein DFH06DRAFT_621865 [Mycena polygramma]|nr:hypothetical protein DFH06DRAFT_621865 [Mycena polygramma]
MPSTPLVPKSKPKAIPAAEGDHRKRRRNRTTQSCLNCHATKRMCDRKRPCSRCSQLGLTGNCVYEIDEPGRQGKQDDETRLMNRIAELEGVIRELKNKPHPRWLADRDRASSSSDGSHPSPTSSGGPSTPSVPAWAFPASPSSTPPGFRFPSQVPDQFSLPSYEADPVESLLSMYAGLSDHGYVRQGGTCGCLNETVCYNVVLELSARLRRAAEVLARSPSHANHSCGLNERISALDTLAKDSLLGVPDHCRSGGMASDNATVSPAFFNEQLYANNEVFSWDMDDLPAHNENLMSWISGDSQ